MELRNRRSSVSQLVLVAGMAVALLTRTFGVGALAGVEAKPRSCQTTMEIAWMYLAHANVFYNLGMME